MDRIKTNRVRVLRSEVVKYWYQHVPEYGKYFIDIGEPNCWACGVPVSTRFDNKNSDATAEECFKIWDKIRGLQVCHIVPKALGGSDDPSNLFLMCKECHELAPDTMFPDIFFKWVEKQTYIMRKMDKITKVLEIYGLDIEQLYHYLTWPSEKTVESEEFDKFFRKNCGIHRSIYGGTKIKESTLIGLLYEFIQLRKKESGEKGSD